MKTDLQALAARVEAATGPDRRLDALIEIALRPDTPQIIGQKPGRFPQKAIWGTARDFAQPLESEDAGADLIEGAYFQLGALPVTASLDAAMTLVPEGLQLAIYTEWPLTKGFPEEPGGGHRITDEMPRGCWVRTYGARDAEMEQATRNVEATAATPALALTAASLRAIASQENEHAPTD